MDSYDSVKQAIEHRVVTTELDLIETYGLTAVTEEIENQALSYADEQLDEIGTSDVSCWILNIREKLEKHHTKDDLHEMPNVPS
jgi:hypothetical protein